MNSNSNSLFHFTSKISTFKKILQKGLRYSFAFETFPKSIIQNVAYGGVFPAQIDPDDQVKQGFAMPMLSFCDIPLMRVKIHSNTYGKFAIGITKDFLCYLLKDFINPVLYIDSSAIYTSINYISKSHGIALKYFLDELNNQNEEVKKIWDEIIENPLTVDNKIKLLPVELQELLSDVIGLSDATNRIISLLKPTYGTNFKGKIQCYYDEREWRAIMPNHPSSAFEKQWCLSREEFESKKNKLNNELDHEEDAFIDIPGCWFNMINHIIVPKEQDVLTITKFINSSDVLLGHHDIGKEEKLHLITKITSFERIEKDF